MGFPILVRWHIYIESGPYCLCCREAATKVQTNNSSCCCNKWPFQGISILCILYYYVACSLTYHTPQFHTAVFVVRVAENSKLSFFEWSCGRWYFVSIPIDSVKFFLIQSSYVSKFFKVCLKNPLYISNGCGYFCLLTHVNVHIYTIHVMSRLEGNTEFSIIQAGIMAV